MLLVENGKSDYVVVIPNKATFNERKAWEELAHFIKQISGARLPVVTDAAPAADKEIILGHNARLQEMGVRANFKKLTDDGFTIRTVGDKLVIAGGAMYGTLYGVYTFLEDHLGCRWWTPAAGYLPKSATIKLKKINETQVPQIIYRDLYEGEAKDATFRARHKMNGGSCATQFGVEQYGVVPGFGGWAHTFFNLVPPDKYFESHPEYFSLVDGKRKASQLCLSNPEVFHISAETLRQLMAADPKQRYYSVSAMDNPEMCTCDECKALDDREEAQSASVLAFVNKLAAEFPDKMISMLAYWPTAKPPKTIKPAKNVQIMFCSGSLRCLPLTQDNSFNEINEWFEIWAKMAPELYLWQYVTYGTHSLYPFPNLRTLQPNMQYFLSQGMTGTFIEASWSMGSEMAELRTYLLAKLLWNPEADVEALMHEFLSGYFGASAGPIRNYIDLAHDAAIQGELARTDKTHFHNVPKAHLTPELVARYEEMFDAAEKLVAGDETLLWRVKHARMPVIYARLMFKYGPPAQRRALAQELREIAARTGTDYLQDFGGKPRDEYINKMIEEIGKETE
jgi:hypothetical protein